MAARLGSSSRRRKTPAPPEPSSGFTTPRPRFVQDEARRADIEALVPAALRLEQPGEGRVLVDEDPREGIHDEREPHSARIFQRPRTCTTRSSESGFVAAPEPTVIWPP